jgi:hypothetical protein
LREPDANLNTRTYFAIFLIATSIAIATVSLAPAFADKAPDHPGYNGLDKADSAIHEHQGANSKTDQNFHKGTCSGGFGAGGFNCP